MRTADTGFRLLVLVTVCWLLCLALPALEQSWFVVPSGSYGRGGSWLSFLLLWLLFRRWQPARALLLLLSSLSLCLVCYVLWYNSLHTGPVLGFWLVLPLHLLVVGTLGFSPSVRRYLASASASYA